MLEFVGGVAREDERVEEARELAGADLLVAHGHVGHAEALEDPAHPALVGIAGPGRIQANARQLARDERVVAALARGDEVERRRTELDGSALLQPREGAPPALAVERRERVRRGARGRLLARELAELCLAHALDHAHAEELGQRPAGYVIGLLDARVLLHVEEILGVHRVGLSHVDPSRAGRIRAPVELDRLLAQVEFDARRRQHVAQALGPAAILVVARDQPAARAEILSAVQRALRSLQHVRKPSRTLARQAPEQRLREAHFIADDVGEPPPATRPRLGEAIRGHVLLQSIRRRELAPRQKHRRREPARGRFRQQPDHVVPHRHVAVAAVPPHVEHPTPRNSREPRARHVEQRAHADEVDPVDHVRIQVRIERIAEGRHEHALGLRALLVHVPIHLRKPLLVEQLRDHARFRETEREPVAVVVVARVALVELLELRPLVGRADELHVVVRHVVEAVGVRAREQQHDAVLAHRLPGLLVGGRERVRELHPELRRRALGRVHRAGDEHEHLALRLRLRELLRARPARVGEQMRILLELLDAREVVLAREQRELHVAPILRLAGRKHRHPRARRIELPVIPRNLLPVREIEVRRQRMPEVLGGRRELDRRCGRGTGGEHEESDENPVDHDWAQIVASALARCHNRPRRVERCVAGFRLHC